MNFRIVAANDRWRTLYRVEVNESEREEWSQFGELCESEAEARQVIAYVRERE